MPSGCFAADARAIALYRISVALATLGSLLLRVELFDAMLGDQVRHSARGMVSPPTVGPPLHKGAMPPETAATSLELRIANWQPTLWWSSAWGAATHLVLEAAVALALLVGFRCRRSALLLYFLELGIQHRSPVRARRGGWGVHREASAACALTASAGDADRGRRVCSHLHPGRCYASLRSDLVG